MGKMRIRKWLKVQTQSDIYLTDKDVNRIGQKNVVKALKISRKYKKKVLINVQPKVVIYDEGYLMFTETPPDRTIWNKPNLEVSQTLEGDTT